MLPVVVTVVLVGLSSALVFGAADFLGGLAAKRLSAFVVTAIAGAAGFFLLLAAIPFTEGRWSSEAVLLGALSGVSGAVAIALLYAALAIGPMSILSPLTAVISALVPVTVGLLQGERLELLGYLALGLALVAVVLVGFVREKHAVRPSLRGLLMATGSGITIGLFLIIINATPDDSGLVPLLANRAVNATLMFAVVGVLAALGWRRNRQRPPVVPPADAVGNRWRIGIALAIACGAVDVLANVGVLFGVRLGELSVVAVLLALYPAGTIILAAIVLKERIAIVQYVGLVLALTAAGMLALQ